MTHDTGELMPLFRLYYGLAVLASAITLAACGTESASNSDSGDTVTVQKTVTEAAPTEPSKRAPAEQEKASDSDDNGSIAVPSVVGRDHQLAQDTMQAAGLYNLEEEDATGQGRSIIVDRNWTVVEQDPPAGSKVSPDTTITLRSKKDDE